MKKGGYKIIDFKNIKFTAGGAGITIPGIFEAVKNTYRKATMLSGLIIGSTEYPDEYGVFNLDGTNYKVVINGTTTITITPADLVTVTNK